MKTSLITSTLALVATCLAFSGAVLAQGDLKDDPAYLDIDSAIDLTEITPEVNVNIPKFLLNTALSEFTGGDDDPLAKLGVNLKELTQDVKLIRVVVIDGKKENAAAIMAGVENLKKQLSKDWISIVAVPKDNVFIYARSDASGEELAGAALLVADGNNLVIGNLVGNVPLGKLAKIAAQLGQDDLEDVLEQLTKGMGAKEEEAVVEGE